jgi:hypothetical protein
VEKLIYLSGRLRINSRDLGKIKQARPLDGFHSAKMAEQGSLASRANTWNFLQSGLTDVFLAANAMRPDRKTVGFIAESLNEIK